MTRRGVGRNVFPAAALLTAALVLLSGVGPGRGPTLSGGAVSGLHSPPSESASPREGRTPGGGVPRLLTDRALEATLAGRNVPAFDVRPPDFSAEGPRGAGPVEPTYDRAPAPMGVADLGLGGPPADPTGYSLNTTSVEGSANLTDARSVYLDGGEPDAFSVQLAAVATGVSLLGNASYEFWAEEFITYSPASEQLAFGDNLWNFSAPGAGFPSSTLFAHGANGSLVAPAFYYANGPTFRLPYPFEVSFYLNASRVGGQSTIFFNYTLRAAGREWSGSVDEAVFDSGPTARTASDPPVFRVDGSAYGPTGLPNDFELVVVGSGSGDTTTFFRANATLALATWNASTGGFESVPTALDAGSDSGETSDGLAVWAAARASPAYLGRGPSFVGPLFGSGGGIGSRTMTIAVAPANAFLFVNPGPTRNASGAEWVPTAPTGSVTFHLPNVGPYFLDVELSDHAPLGLAVDPPPNGSVSATVTLAPDRAAGVYTALFAWGNGELPNISSSGDGSRGDPFVVYDNEAAPLDGEFAAWNDFEFPVFPGLLLVDTSAFVTVTPPPWTVDFPAPMAAEARALGLPSTDELGLELWNVTNAVVHDGRAVSGWSSASLAPFPEGEILGVATFGDLIANNTFEDEGCGVTLVGGTGDVVWGNTFTSVAVNASDPSAVLDGGTNLTAVTSVGSGDLVYNNVFRVPVGGSTPTFAGLDVTGLPSGGAPVPSWNVSREPASAVRTVLGVPLTGSILGTDYQGGNVWAEYGTRAEPYGVLPLNASGKIERGGDFVPLVPFVLYPVTFVVEGLPAATPWTVTTLGAVVTTSGNASRLYDPNGSYSYGIGSVPGYAAVLNGTVAVSGESATVTTTFVLKGTLTFVETGLPGGTSWSVTVVPGSDAGSPRRTATSYTATVSVSLVPGPYAFVVLAVGYAAVPSNGSVVLAAGETVLPVAFGPPPGPSGAPAGAARPPVGPEDLRSCAMGPSSRAGSRPPSGDDASGHGGPPAANDRTPRGCSLPSARVSVGWHDAFARALPGTFPADTPYRNLPSVIPYRA